MLGFLSRARAGDTLIEVLFAITTFSLVVVSSLAIMNQGTAASMRSLQITLVRQEIDSQAETLRFLSSAYVNTYYAGYIPNVSDSVTSPAEEYYKLLADIGSASTSASKFGGDDPAVCPTAPETSFILNAREGRYGKNLAGRSVPADVYSQVIYSSLGNISQNQGIWIEPARPAPEPGKPRYIDFHIRACWEATGSGTPMNLGTIVRLYEPTN